MKALCLSEEAVQVNVTSPDDVSSSIQEIKKDIDQKNRTSLFNGISEAEMKSVNQAFDLFSAKAKKLFENNLITSYSYGIYGEGLFLLTTILNGLHGPCSESRIIRASTMPDGRVELSIIGKNLKSSKPEQFAEILFCSLEKTLLQRKEQERQRTPKEK